MHIHTTKVASRLLKSPIYDDQLWLPVLEDRQILPNIKARIRADQRSYDCLLVEFWDTDPKYDGIFLQEVNIQEELDTYMEKLLKDVVFHKSLITIMLGVRNSYNLVENIMKHVS